MCVTHYYNGHTIAAGSTGRGTRVGTVSGPASGRPAPTEGRRTLAEVYRRFGDVEASGTSPLHARIAAALSESDEALRAIESAPAGKRHPAVVLAALHDLALAGRAPRLAVAYALADHDAAVSAAVDTLVGMTGGVVAVAVRRPVRAHEAGRHAVLHPAVAEAAHRVGAEAVGLVDVGCSAGLSLVVDRVGIDYGRGVAVGDASSPVQVAASVVGDRHVPGRTLPPVVARVGIDLDPVDVTDPEEARWLRACLQPDQPQQMALLDAELALAASDPPQLLRGDVLEVLPDALARVPPDALPVVTTTWTLSHLPLERRLRFLHRLDEAAAGRTVAWVSVEGVGVAPGVPTMGDRHASGHSIIGVAVLEHARLRAEAVGRCWSHGRALSWLAEG